MKGNKGKPGGTAAPVQVLLISGSVRSRSFTRTLAAAVEQTLRKNDVYISHWNLRSHPLPIADPRFHADPSRHPDKVVRLLVQLAETSDALVLASPVYHNSYSGVLKNALDHLAIQQIWYKPVGLLSHGGNRSTQAVDQLRIVVRGLLGVAIPTQVCTAASDFVTEPKAAYELQSSEIVQRIDRFVQELIIFARSFQVIRSALK